MKKLLILLALFAICIGCNNEPKKNDKPTIYIKTTTKIGSDQLGENPKQEEKDTITIVESDYFEVALSQKGDDYLGHQKVVTEVTTTNYKVIYFTIVQKNGMEIKFEHSTDFLNFISERGYEMASQEKNKYGADYVFKRKN